MRKSAYTVRVTSLETGRVHLMPADSHAEALELAAEFNAERDYSAEVL